MTKRGQITFTENNLVNPLYIEEFSSGLRRPISPENKPQKMTMTDALNLMPFREQMKYLKHQRAKKKNLFLPKYKKPLSIGKTQNKDRARSRK